MYEQEQFNQQQPQIIQTSPYQSPMYDYGSSIMLLTDPIDELNKMELTLRSARLVNKKVIKVGDPLLNELGIHSVIGQVQSVVNQVTIMSSLSKKDIPMLLDFLADTLAKDLLLNRTNYNIKTPAARDRIYFIALTSAYICMKRAFEESISDKKFWRNTQQEIFTKTENAPKKSGFFSKYLGWGGK